MYRLSYLCFRLLGAALPLLSKEQLQLVMRGDLILHYGEHVVTAKVGAALSASTARTGQAVGAASCHRARWLRLVLPGIGKHSSYWEGPGTWVSLVSG